jgi:RNA polymerase sigma factor (TIGR02999 family)
MAETSAKPATTTLTGLLGEVRRGDPQAPGRLFTLVYDKLREIARIQRRRQPAAETLNTTALVHEAFLKLFGAASGAASAGGGRDFKDRAHFMAVAATAMRQILIGHARRKAARKRGAGEPTASLDEVERSLLSGVGLTNPSADALLALDRALVRLQELSERQSRIVEYRFFAGMSIEETADALGISPATVKRDWSMAQAWLHRELQRELG